MQITIIGTGFVGVVSAAVYASFGHRVIGLDIDQNKIEKLRQGVVPFYEPGLSELLVEQQQHGNLTFTTSYQEAISEAEIIIIAVGTPSAPDGQADLKYVFASAESVAPYLQPKAIIVIKSTVPPGTLEKVQEKVAAKTKTIFYTASLPEFLREGSAVEDTLHPDRIVIGANEPEVMAKLEELHKPLNAPIVKIKPESAQMAKYAANSYLATRITFINQIADLCEKNGADVQDIIAAIGFDKRIGKHYWYPGLGYGGSCFPKDVKELAAYSRAVGEENNLLNKVNELNEQRIWRLLDKYAEMVGGWEGKKVAILGLSFKPNTDDMREAPSTKIIPYLINRGAQTTGFDPQATWTANMMTTTETAAKTTENGTFTQAKTIEDATKDADIILSVIEWPEILQFDFAKARAAQKKQWFIDARNQFTPKDIQALGYTYIGTGRPQPESL
jgi:UDPglucose 6-dehydrogenase